MYSPTNTIKTHASKIYLVLSKTLTMQEVPTVWYLVIRCEYRCTQARPRIYLLCMPAPPSSATHPTRTPSGNNNADRPGNTCTWTRLGTDCIEGKRKSAGFRKLLYCCYHAATAVQDRKHTKRRRHGDANVSYVVLYHNAQSGTVRTPGEMRRIAHLESGVSTLIVNCVLFGGRRFEDVAHFTARPSPLLRSPSK